VKKNPKQLCTREKKEGGGLKSFSQPEKKKKGEAGKRPKLKREKKTPLNSEKGKGGGKGSGEKGAVH